MVAAGAPPPAPWAKCERVVVDVSLLSDEAPLARTVAKLHRAWAERRPVVVELGVAAADLAAPEASDRPPWELGATFTFLRERLHFLVWANSYDARQDPPVWWWGRKAEPVGARTGGPADVVLPGGEPAWIDGGPRGPVAGIPETLVHSESVVLGLLTPVPSAADAPADLAPDQAEAVVHRSGPARIIAPAGSGKTRTLTARFRHLLAERAVEPEIVCAVAYNNRAAAELRDRLGDGASRAQVRTIHSLGWEILREARGPLALLDERDVRARLDPMVRVPRRPNTDVVGPFLEALAEVRIGLRSPEEVEADRDDVAEFADVYRRYRQHLDRRGEADFDEQVFGAIEALAADADLRRRWQARCRHLLVDEFQDLTPAYLLLIRLVASPGLDVFGVGDDDQTIYGYLGADPGFLIDYRDLFPGAGAHALEVNYRCPEAVVEAATNLLGYNRRRLPKTIKSGPDSVAGTGALEVEKEPSARLALAAADRIEEWLADGDPADVAVLCRVNSALLPVHAALAARSLPFASPLGPDVLHRTVLAAALAWLRIGAAPDSIRRADLMAAVRRPSRGLNRVASGLLARRGPYSIGDVAALGERLEGRQAGRWGDFTDDLERVARAAELGDAADLLDVVISGVGLESAALALDSRRTRVDRSAQSDDLAAIRRVAAIRPDLDGFEPWLREVLARPSVPGGVLLTTIHRVKGMEWDRVLVFGADRGLMPHALSTDWEEERRVFHVALTRCRREVTVLADRARPSPFLAELAGAAPAPAAPAPPVAAPRLVPPPPQRPADPELVGRLKAWRLETARSRGVPAYVVMHDSTLEAIAAIRPQDERALAAVPGIGPAKLDAYGDDLLAMCALS